MGFISSELFWTKTIWLELVGNALEHLFLTFIDGLHEKAVTPPGKCGVGQTGLTKEVIYSSQLTNA